MLQGQSAPQSHVGDIQVVSDPEEIAQSTAARAATVHAEAFQRAGALLWPQVAAVQHARHHRRVPALPPGAPRRVARQRRCRR